MQPSTKKSLRAHRSPSEFARQIWTLVARRGMTLQMCAKHMDTTLWRVERILVGMSRRNARRWH